MRFVGRMLSEDERARIHQESLKILWEVGVKFHSPQALQILKRNGAVVDNDSGIARIPEESVNSALETAPKSFVLGARNGDLDFPMPSEFTGFNLDAGGIYFLDYKTGVRRKGLYKDNIDVLRVFDAMDMGNIVWTCSAEDVSGKLSTVRLSIESFKYTAKHIQDELLCPEEVPYLIEALSVLAGGEKEAKDRKLYSVCYCTIPPLTHDKEMCEAYLELGKFAVPILIYPMNAPGTSGPASLFSTVAVANAENLSSLVLFQAANPGSPIIFGDANLSTDFRTGNFLAGTPEMILQTNALGEMARFYGLPNEQGGCLTDAKAPGPQAVMEKMLTTIPLIASGADVVQGLGAIECSNTVVLEQIVVDNEIARQCRRLQRGIDINDAESHFSDIAEIGPGGSFLGSETTVEACRSGDFYESRLTDTSCFDKWEETGSPGIYKRAGDIVEEILSSPPKYPLSDDQVGKLDEIVCRLAKDQIELHQGAAHG